MSKEYIEREKVIEVIKNYGKNAIDIGQSSLDPVDDIILLQGAVNMIPAADVIVPPCKVGDIVYYIHETFYDNEYMKAKEDEIDFSHIIKVVERPNCKTNLMLKKAQFDWLLMDSWLKGDVFLTKEEAEKALAERREE